ncbi:MAG: ATP-binding protein [Chitinophagaceae bacterium]
MLFSSIPGQHEVKEKLVQLVTNNRLSHALLFLGKEGSGALQLATALAQYIVCENKSNDACGACPSCKKASALMHPDIHYSFPTITKTGIDKPVCNDFIEEWRNFNQENPYGNVYDWLQTLDAENKQGNITAHECEDILHKLNLKSFESGYKILIQWMPEYLGNVGNKLLKLIEEPPAQTLFILVAEDESKILPTILSRTQLIKINRVATNDIQSWLMETLSVPKDKAIAIAPLAQGNLREAMHLLHHGDENWQDLLRDWLNAIIKNGPGAQVKWVDEMGKIGREKQKQFIAYFIHLLSISIRISNNEVPHDIAENEIDFSQRLLKLADTAQIQSMVEELDKSIYYIERNANPKMLFMALGIKFYHIIKDKMVILIN